MIFRGITKSYVTVLSKKRLPWASVKRKFLTFPERPGGHLSGTDTEPLPLEVTILIESEGFSSLQKAKEDLAGWLVTEQAESLIFKDEQDREYYAAIEGSLNLDEMVRVGQGTILFICPEPYKHGPEQTVPLDGTPISNDGTAKSFPLVRATFEQEASFFAISNGDKILQIGEPPSAETTPVPKFERILNDELSSVAAWADDPGLAVGLGHTVAGTMVSQNSTFVAQSFGTGTGWHGPAKKRSLPAPLQDFQVNADIYFRTLNADELGKIFIFLLDVNSEIVGRLSFLDAWAHMEAGVAEYRVGNNSVNHQIDSTEGNKQLFKDFNGTMRIVREGDRWQVYTARVVGERHTHMRREYFHDKNQEFMAPIAQIAIYYAQYKTHPTPRNEMAVGNIEVFKINDIPDNEVPLLFAPGDVLEVDMSIPMAYKNGAEFMDDYQPASDPVTIHPGENNFAVIPEGVATTELIYRPRWK